MPTNFTCRNDLARPLGLRLTQVAAAALLLLPGSAWAQLTGTKTVPGTYPTLAAAIADLNAQGVGAGGVTFNVAAGYAETFASPTAGLITLNSSSTNAGAATRPIVFQKMGSGANPLITAGVGTGASDAIIAVAGTDYVSFTNIDVAENAANTTPTTQMEAGYALYRASATDGSQYVQVTGATITLNRANTNSVGILSVPTTAAGVAVVTTSDVTGSNNNNKFNGNTVTNAFIGISVLGSAGGVGYPDYYTEIGSTTGNVLRGLGGSDVSAYGIRCEQQLGPKIENNTISILAGNLTTPVSGIRLDGLLIGSILIHNNTVTITSATTGTVAGIWQASSRTQSGFITRTVSNNKIQNCVLTGTGSGDVYYLAESTNSARATCVISGNQITGNSTTTAGGVYGIIGGRGSGLSVSDNTVAGNVKAGASAPAGSAPTGFTGILSISSNSLASFTNNTVANNRVTATGASLLYGIQCAQSISSGQTISGNTVSGNELQCSSGTLGALYLKSDSPYSTSSMSGQDVLNNTVVNNALTATSTTTASAAYGIYNPEGGSRNNGVSGNVITGLSISGVGAASGNTLTGIYSPVYNVNATRNTIGDLRLGTAGAALSGTVTGLFVSSGNSICERNKLYGLSASGASSQVYGLYSLGNATLTNNLIGDLTAPAATSPLAVTGIYITTNSNMTVLYNTVYLNASSTGATFGTAALYLDGRPGSGMTLRNNILVNTSTAAGAGGYTTAFRWINGTPSTDYSGDYNDLYAGPPSATNLLYVGGTATNGTITSVANPKQMLADYKAFMAPFGREQNSVSELPPFLSTSGSSAGFLHIDPTQYTQVANAGQATNITTDYDGDVRSTTTPDIGADEFANPGQDVGITALVQPGTGGSPVGTQPVEVTIRNFSATATTLPVPVQVVVTAPGGATQTLSASYASPLAAGGSANLVVGNLLVTGSGSYGFVATTTYANDPVPGNNVFSTSVLLTTPNATAWTGAVSTDWYDAANWSAGVPTATLDAQVPVVSSGRYPVVASGNAATKKLTLSTGAALTQSGGTLSLTGDLTNNGTFVATGGTLATTGSAGQTLGGSSPLALYNLSIGAAGTTLGTATSLRQVLTLTGDLTTSGQTLTLRSSVSGGMATDALVVNSGGVVVGTATVQRAIDPSLNPNAGYRHYSTPVSGSTVNDLATTATGGSFAPVVNAAYNTAAVPDLVRPFPTVFGYDDSRLGLANNTRSFDKGFFSPATLGEALAVGRGYTVNIAASQLVAFRGTLTNGDLTLPFTSTRNTYPDGGWQLLGNPYPAPLDYSRVAAADRAGLEGAIYVYSSTGQYTGQYRSYVNGIGNPVLPVGQGFFARAASGVVSGTMIFRNSQRLTAPSGTTFQRPAEARPLVQLTLQAGALADEATVYFEQGATGGFEPAFDAEKLANPTGLNLATTHAGQQLSIDGQPALGTAQHVVPLAVGVPAPGVYTLITSRMLNLATVPVYLRDAQTGALVDLAAQPSYQFTVSNAAAPSTTRFALVFSPQQALATAPVALAEQVALYPNPARMQATIELPASLSRQPVTATLLDALGRVVRQQVLPAGGAAHPLPLAGLTSGVYSLRLATEQGAVVKKLVVE
jgi:hypothetical protein